MKLNFSANKTYIIILLILVFAIVINGTPFLFGDAYGYFHNAKTLVTQGRFSSQIKPEYIDYAAHGVVESGEGTFINAYPPGTSIIWYPFLKLALLFEDGTINNDYFKAFNGHSFADGFAILISSMIFTFLAIILLRKILIDKGFSPRLSLIAIFGAYISTFAISYLTEQPGYSHTYEIFAIVLFLFFLEKFRKNSKSYLFAIGIGLAASLLISLRLTNALLLLPTAIVLIKYWKKIPLMILGALPILIFMFTYNYVNYGGILASGYKLLWNQSFDFSNFYLANLLFSDFRGLLFWSPAVLIALASLWIKYRDKWHIFVYAIPPLLMFIPYSFWPYWYGGDSIGQRFLIVLVPYVAVGLAMLIKLLKDNNQKVLLLILAIIILYSGLIAMFYRISPTPRLIENNSEKAVYYKENGGIPSEYLSSPKDIFNYQINLITSSDSPSEYLSSLKSGFNGGRSLLLIAVGQTTPLINIEYVSDSKFNIHVIPKPFAKETKANLSVYIKGDINEALLFENIRLDEYNKIEVECIDSCLMNTSSVQIPFSEDKNNKLSFIKLNDGIEIAIESDVEFKLINEKVKTKR